jgi:hypothetical protein
LSFQGKRPIIVAARIHNELFILDGNVHSSSLLLVTTDSFVALAGHHKFLAYLYFPEISPSFLFISLQKGSAASEISTKSTNFYLWNDESVQEDQLSQLELDICKMCSATKAIDASNNNNADSEQVITLREQFARWKTEKEIYIQ